MQSANKKFSLTKFKLFLDFIVLAFFIAINIPQFFFWETSPPVTQT